MDNTYHHAPPDKQQSSVYNGGYPETPYAANRAPPSGAAHGPTQPDHTASRWTPSLGYDGNQYGLRCDFPAPSPGAGGFGGPCLPPPYGFDPSVPPPPFGCPPPGHFSIVAPAAPLNAYSSREASTFQTFTQQFRPGPQTVPYNLDSNQKQQHGYEDFSESGAPFGCPLFPVKDHDRGPGTTTTTRAEDETSLQRRRDQQWLRRFLQSKDRTSKVPPQTQRQQHGAVPDLRRALYRAAQLVAQLAESCEALRTNVDNHCVWTDSYLMALNVKTELQDKLGVLSDRETLDSWKAKLARVAKRRARRLRARRVQLMEEAQREERISEKEAAIDKWRTQQIQRVEEKKKEQELKLAADAVLCEVRKKQADVKRMQDILRSLEKLRRLRKEAASRKGIVTERDCDEDFSSRLEQLRRVMKKRTAVYSAEEKALMVMLEGEQEEERRREREKRVKKERERQLQRKLRVDAMLFGDEPPADSALQPFREYYTQAERSLHALLQIRRGWDVFVVAADHPDGSPVPQSWILPEAPSDQAWASALQTADTEPDVS
ncbi:programmed cell death protein 7 [Micropterus salmoides]|uniref:programmed cell death protein 7 n=1 Tax=Micropterus salmoides TaxID=27706 RepID=UPI0018EC9C82|nr:programmed cell death protein 7 [Micropterus salmoides]